MRRVSGLHAERHAGVWQLRDADVQRLRSVGRVRGRRCLFALRHADVRCERLADVHLGMHLGCVLVRHGDSCLHGEQHAGVRELRHADVRQLRPVGRVHRRRGLFSLQHADLRRERHADVHLDMHLGRVLVRHRDPRLLARRHARMRQLRDADVRQLRTVGIVLGRRGLFAQQHAGVHERRRRHRDLHEQLHVGGLLLLGAARVHHEHHAGVRLLRDPDLHQLRPVGHVLGPRGLFAQQHAGVHER